MYIFPVKEKILEIERGSTISHPVENSLFLGNNGYANAPQYYPILLWIE
jgi:hypothetical protein